MKACPKCGLNWQDPCEQTVSIELFGECISCRRYLITEAEIEQIVKAVNDMSDKGYELGNLEDIPRRVE